MGEALGLDGLKVELGKLGLKQGGDLKQRASRLFALKGKKLEDLPKKFFAKGGGGSVSSPSDSALVTTTASKKDIAALEAEIAALLMQLRPVLDATARRAERRMTQTSMEKRREREEEITGALKDIKKTEGDGENDSDSEEEEIYNPKNVPLGWDGKPM